MYKINREKTNVEVDVTISNEEWEKAVEDIYQKNKSKYVVAGFRKGHAPRKAIEKEYGDGVFFDETLDHFVNETLDEIVHNDSELEPAVQPVLEFQSYSVSEGTKFKIKWEIVPEFKLPKYTGLEIVAHDGMHRLDASVESEINMFLREHSKLVDVDRAAQLGDTVVIDFIGFINNVEFEGGSAENYPLELGRHMFIDNFEEQLVGTKKGDKVDVNVTFPEKYSSDLAGRKATFKVEVKNVRERQTPALDDKLISDTTEFETVEEYKKDLKEKVAKDIQENTDRDFRLNIVKHICKNTEMSIPDPMIDAQLKQRMQYYDQIAALYGMTLEEYAASMEKCDSFEEYKEKMREAARDDIKRQYILRKIIKEENITCTQEEFDEKMKDVPEEKRHEIQQIHEAESSVLLAKTYDFLMKNNTRKIVKDDCDDDCECHDDGCDCHD